VRDEPLLEAHREVDQLVLGLPTLFKKVELSISKAIITCFIDTVITVALTKMSSFNQPMRQLVRRFDLLQERLLEALKQHEASKQHDEVHGKSEEESMGSIAETYLSGRSFTNRLVEISRSRVGQEALNIISNCAPPYLALPPLAVA
jgi:hypothetical protein